MGKLDQNKVALATGGFLGLFHALWSLLVAVGFAQPLLDFVYSLHFLNNPFSVASFDLGRALLLVVMTFVVGYAIGWVFTMIWNMVVKK